MAVSSFAKIILNRLTSELRPRGFRRHSQTYIRPVNDCFQILNLQASQFGNSARQRYTVNLAVYSTRLEPLEKDPEKLKEYEGHWQARVGRLTVEDRDVWWQVQSGEEASAAAEAIVKLLPIILATMNGVSSYEAILRIPQGPGATYDDPPGGTFKRPIIAEGQRREGLPVTEAIEYIPPWRSTWHRRHYPGTEGPDCSLNRLDLDVEKTLRAYVGPVEE